MVLMHDPDMGLVRLPIASPVLTRAMRFAFGLTVVGLGVFDLAAQRPELRHNLRAPLPTVPFPRRSPGPPQVG